MSVTDRERKNKPVEDSSLEMQQIELFPENSDPNGIFFGSRILQIVEEVAALVAKKHAEQDCVMRRLDCVRFYQPVRKGDILYCSASVNKVWDSTMEIGVKVEKEDFRSLERKKVLSAYFTFQALDENLKPVSIDLVEPSTDLQKLRFRQAEARSALHVAEH